MNARIGINAIWVTIILLVEISPAFGNNYVNQIQHHIQEKLYLSSQVKYQDCGISIQRSSENVLRFYSLRNYLPAWIDEVGLKPEASILIGTIESAKEEGLPQAAYPVSIIDDLKVNTISNATNKELLSPKLAAQLDIALSTSFFLHSSYLAGDRLKSDYFKDVQGLKKASIYYADDLEQALTTHTLDLLLSKLPPPHKKYLKLIDVKKQYERIVAAGGWTKIPSGPTLEKGKHDNRILLLRERLKLSGDLLEPLKKDLDYFDEDIKKAVQNFQRRHGLYPDGVLGPSTLRELNISAEDRLVQILVNLERWRLLPHNLGQKYIEVNIPNYQLSLVEQGEIVQSMRVMVGRINRQTPILSGEITYLEINPYWTVPPQIAKKDILPKVQQDPSYLIRKNIRVFENWQASAAELDPFTIDWSKLGDNHFPYKLRQEPNDQNALGKVKFMFPNKLSVYLHDTPSKELFKQQQRSFSSGCVRVEKPLELAADLLANQDGWNKKRLNTLLEKGSSKVILLKTAIPVYLLYWTAWIEDDNELHFRHDIYGRDKALARALEKQLPNLITCQNNLMSEQMVMSQNNHHFKQSDNSLDHENTYKLSSNNKPLAALSKK